MVSHKTIQVGDFKIGAEERNAIIDVLDSGIITEGHAVRSFEHDFSSFIGTKYAVTTNSGTSALIAGLTALKYLDIAKANTKILTTPLTYISTSSAIVLSGFSPAYVDVDPETFVITPDRILEYFESTDGAEDCSVILPVHLMGYACDMKKINAISKKFGNVVFEDSAEALGTIYDGKRIGNMSLLSAFSFYIAHNIQAGEMGAITTNSPEIRAMASKIKANGRTCDCFICTRNKGICPKSFKGDEDLDPRFTHDVIGYNFKTMEFQAAIALTQLKKAEWIIKKRNDNVKRLNELLEKHSDILQLPKHSSDISYLAYPLVIKKPQVISRKNLREKLEKMGVETRPLFGCIPTQQPAFAHLKQQYKNKLPNAEYLGKNAFYVGCHQYLSDEDLEYIAKCFSEVLK